MPQLGITHSAIQYISFVRLETSFTVLLLFLLKSVATQIYLIFPYKNNALSCNKVCTFAYNTFSCREHYKISQLWAQAATIPGQSSCLFKIKKKHERKIIIVGRGCEHETLKSALSVATDYDKIYINSGEKFYFLLFYYCLLAVYGNNPYQFGL